MRSGRFHADETFNENRKVFRVENDRIKHVPHVDIGHVHQHSLKNEIEDILISSKDTNPNSLEDEEEIFIIDDDVHKKKFADAIVPSATTLRTREKQINSQLKQKYFEIYNKDKDDESFLAIEVNPFINVTMSTLINNKETSIKGLLKETKTLSNLFYTELPRQIIPKYIYTPFKVKNRVVGTPKLKCLDNGTIFSFETLKPFTGKVFIENEYCSFTFNGIIHPEVEIFYEKCSLYFEIESNYLFNINIIFDNDTDVVTSYKVECLKIDDSFIKHVDLVNNMTNTSTMSKMSVIDVMPSVDFNVIKNGGMNTTDGTIIGNKLKFIWRLVNGGRMYDFLITNCILTSLDKNYTLLDKYGCSMDTRVISHPHYDKWNKMVSSYFLAFKIPNIDKINIQCDYKICTTIKNNQGLSNCDNIGTPPTCPLIT
uniref:ZP domain-containing protein n=1 Tax=Parastrongyloides trichosuri TaxID=131310 RepID=A0A0N5A1X1_PARTI